MARVCGPRLPIAALLPSPPSSPPPPERPPPSDGFSQLALTGRLCAYTTPDHSRGESFPGKQSPTLQLSLFEAGVTRVRTPVSSRRA